MEEYRKQMKEKFEREQSLKGNPVPPSNQPDFDKDMELARKLQEDELKAAGGNPRELIYDFTKGGAPQVSAAEPLKNQALAERYENYSSVQPPNQGDDDFRQQMQGYRRKQEGHQGASLLSRSSDNQESSLCAPEVLCLSVCCGIVVLAIVGLVFKSL